MKRRSDGRWVRVVTVNGKRHSFYSSADTESKAEKDIRKQILAFEHEKEDAELFRSVAERWEVSAYDSIAHGTIKNYKPSVKSLVDAFGDMPCDRITAPDILRYFSSLKAQGFSAKTARNRKSVLNLIIKFAIGEGIITANPVPELPLPKNMKNKKQRSLEEEEISIIKAHKNDGYWGLLAFFLLSTGLRRGEAFALTYGDIDSKNLIIKVSKTIEHHGNAGIIKNHTKTEAGMRKVPIPQDLADMFPTDSHKANDLIFPDPIKGGPITNAHTTKGWDSYRYSVGIDEVTMHMLRHNYATMLYDAGIDVKTAQYILGHEDLQTTMRIYTHLSKDKLQKGNDAFREKLTKILF